MTATDSNHRATLSAGALADELEAYAGTGYSCVYAPADLFRTVAATLRARAEPPSSQDLTELQKIAEQATPGKWVHHETIHADNHVTAGGGVLTGTHVCGPTYERANAAYIAAFGPETTKELLERLSRAEALLAQVHRMDEGMMARVIAESMPGWNDDTREPGLEGTHRQMAEAHWERVNATCLEQGAAYVQALMRRSSEWMPLDATPPPTPRRDGRIEAALITAEGYAEKHRDENGKTNIEGGMLLQLVDIVEQLRTKPDMRDAASAAKPRDDTPPDIDTERIAAALMNHTFNSLGECTCGHTTPDYKRTDRERWHEEVHFSEIVAQLVKDSR